MMKKAFTLIELLVVIAIIAILAAILFPVFAQAKAAAKKTTCISNAKQVNLANLMYENDNDDAIVLDCSSPVGTVGNDFYTWQDLVQPYVKTQGLDFCPINYYQGTTLPFGAPGRPTYDYITSYGIISVVSSIGNQTGTSYSSWVTRSKPWLQNVGVPAGTQYDGVAGWADLGGWWTTAVTTAAPSVTATSVARPAEYAFINESGNFDAWHGTFTGNGNVGFGWCGSFTGGSGAYDWTFFGPSPKHNGNAVNSCDTTDTTGVNERGFNKGFATTSFLDGHAKSLKGPALFKLTDDGTHMYYYTIGS